MKFDDRDFTPVVDIPTRQSCDNVIHTRERSLLAFGKTADVCFVNGRYGHDKDKGNFT